MNQIICFARCEDGAGMEGMGTWNNGPRSAPKCAHRTFIVNKWVIKVILHITHAANVRLLDFIINYWDHDLGMFDLQGETLEITTEDMYFITGLSRQGAPVNLEGTSRGSDPLSVKNYIDVFCTPGTQKRGSCVPIIHIRDFTLQVLENTIVRISGSSSLHLATWNQMRLAVDFMHGDLYD